MRSLFLLAIALFAGVAAATLTEASAGTDIATRSALFLQQGRHDWEEEIQRALAGSDKIQRDIIAKDWSQLMVDADELIDGEHWTDEQIAYARHQVAGRIHMEEIHTMDIQVPETPALDEEALTKEFKAEVAEGDWPALLADATARIDLMPWTAEQKATAKEELATHAVAFENLAKKYAPVPGESAKDEREIEYTLEKDTSLTADAEKNDLAKLKTDADAEIEAQSWSREKKNVGKLEVAKYDKFQQMALAFQAEGPAAPAALLQVANDKQITPEQAAELERVLGDNFKLLKDAEAFDWDKLEREANEEIDEQDWDFKDLAHAEVKMRMDAARADAAKLAAMKAAPALLQVGGDVEADIKAEIADDADIQALVSAKDFDKLEAAAMAKIDGESWGKEEKDQAKKEVAEHIAEERKDGDGAALLQEGGDHDDLKELVAEKSKDFAKLQAEELANIDDQDWSQKEKDDAKKEIAKTIAEERGDGAALAEDLEFLFDE